MFNNIKIAIYSILAKIHFNRILFSKVLLKYFLLYIKKLEIENIAIIDVIMSILVNNERKSFAANRKNMQKIKNLLF